MNKKIIISLIVLSLLLTGCNTVSKDSGVGQKTEVLENESVEGNFEIMKKIDNLNKMDTLKLLNIVQFETEGKTGVMTEDDAVSMMVGFRGSTHKQREDKLEPLETSIYVDEILRIIGYLPKDGQYGIGPRGDYNTLQEENNVMDFAIDIGIVDEGYDKIHDEFITYEKAYDIVFKALKEETHDGVLYAQKLVEGNNELIKRVLSREISEENINLIISGNIMESSEVKEELSELVREINEYVGIYQEGEKYNINIKELVDATYSKDYGLINAVHSADVEYKGDKHSSKIYTNIHLIESKLVPFEINHIAQEMAMRVIKLGENEEYDFASDEFRNIYVAIRGMGSGIILREYKIKYNENSFKSEIEKWTGEK